MNILIYNNDNKTLSSITDEIREILSKSAYCDYSYFIKSFSNALVTAEYCKNNDVDIAFLDIDVKKGDIYYVFDILQETNRDALIIFISNMDHYIYTSFKYRPFRFITKSNVKNELKEAVISAVDEIENNSQFLVAGAKYGNEKILLSDIMYFESKRNYIEIVCINGNKYLYRDCIKNFENKYRLYRFIRTHSGFIVNMKFIEKIHKNTFLLKNGAEIPISRKYLSNVRNEYLKYMGSKKV